MNPPECEVRAKAKRRVPGVNVPVAAPRLALDFTSAPSCASVRPWAAGNWLVCGFSAAGSSLTAGGIGAVLAVEVVVLVVAG